MNFSRFPPLLLFMHQFRKLPQPIHQTRRSGDAHRLFVDIAREIGRAAPRTALIVNDPRK
jgi:hypothetical protein